MHKYWWGKGSTANKGDQQQLSITVGFNLVHLEYSASYLISCWDSGKSTVPNLDIHRYLVRVKAQSLNNWDWLPGSQKIGPLLYSTEGLAITKKNVDW